MNNNDYVNFASFCKNTFDLKISDSIPTYKSLPMCILDDVFSLQADYDVVVKPVIENYSKYFLNGNQFKKGHTLKRFMKNIDSCSSYKEFTNLYIKRNNKSCNRFKIELCYELSRKLVAIGINDLSDFKKYAKKNSDIIEIIIKSVKGLSDQATNYLFMLAGDQNRVKVDTHINKAVKAVFGKTLNDDETQDLFAGTVKILKQSYPNLTMAKLDNIIWTFYHNN